VHGDNDRAARLDGAADALRGAIGSPLPPNEQCEHERRLSELRAALGDGTFERAFTAGRALTWEQAVAYALEGGEA
jgi:hypothetical protein